MNITNTLKRTLSAQFLAAVTIASLLLSAFPAAFFVALAETEELTQEQSSQEPAPQAEISDEPETAPETGSNDSNEPAIPPSPDETELFSVFRLFDEPLNVIMELDDVRPVIEVITPDDELLTNGDFTITVKATDDVGLGQMVVNIKDEFGANIGTCLNESAGGAAEFTASCTIDVSQWGVGNFQFRTNARDTAGNISNTINQKFTIFDNTKPVTYLLTPITGLVTDTDFDITIRSTDDIALEKMVVNLKNADGEQLLSCLNATVSGTDVTRTCTVDVDALGEGDYQFKTNARDTSGNVSNTILQTFTVRFGDAPRCTNLLTNGSFETPVVTNTSLWDKFASVAGWAINKAIGGDPTTLEIHRGWSGNQAAEGSQYVELDGDESSRITQTVATIPGATYELKWAFAGRHDLPDTQNQLSVEVDGTQVATEGPVNGLSNLLPASWKKSSYTFTADASTDISFADAGATSDSYGTFLDDAQLCLVKKPEPLPACTLTIKSDVSDYVVEKNAAAKILSFVHSNWVPTLGLSSAVWIWGDNPVIDPTAPETQTFKKGFNWTGGVVTNATLKVSSDNTHKVTLGSFTVTDSGEFNYGPGDISSYNVASAITPGANLLEIAVGNIPVPRSIAKGNPAGLMYELTITGTGESCGSVTPIEPKPTTGSIEITKYACPANTSVLRSQNGVGKMAPVGCVPQTGATFGYVKGTQTDAKDPYPELDPTATIVAAGATLNGLLTIPNLPATGRYLIVETGEENQQLPANDILGLYCEGDGDTSDTNDNQELTFVEAGETVKCVAYNKMSIPDDNDPKLYRIDGFKYEELGDDSDVPKSGWTINLYDEESNSVLALPYLSTTTDSTGYYYFDVPEGEWRVEEKVKEGWSQEDVTSNMLGAVSDSDGDNFCQFTIPGRFDYTRTARLTLNPEVTDWPVQLFENYRCDFYNVQEKIVPPPVDVCLNTEVIDLVIPVGFEKVGDSEICTPIAVDNDDDNRNNNNSSTRVARVAGEGSVLGASTMQCGMYLFDYTRMGLENDKWEVTKLQWFLNGQGFFIPVTGVFDEATDKAVRDFQMKYQADVLTPWFTAGIVPHQNPTGWMYQLTRWKINNIVCPGSEALPVLN